MSDKRRGNGVTDSRVSLGDIQHRIIVTPTPSPHLRNRTPHSPPAHHMRNTVAVEPPAKPPEKKDHLVLFILSQLDIHGIGSLIKAEQLIVRSIWVFILLLAAGIMTFGLYQNVRDYLENPILTSYDVLSGEAMEFPEVYICPTNFINYTFVRENKVNLTWATYFSSGLQSGNRSGDGSSGSLSFLNLKQSLWERISIVPAAPPVEEMEPPWYPRELQGNSSGIFDPDGNWVPFPTLEYENTTTSTSTSSTTTTTTTRPPLFFTSLQQYFLAIGYKKEEFVKECSFQGQSLDCGEITKEYFDKDHGKCFLVQVNDSQRKAGEGLSLVLDINTGLYPPSGVLVEQPIFDGAYLMIRRRFHPAIVDKILVSPGEYTKIGLDARRIKRVSGNHGGEMKYCRSETKGFKVLELKEYSVDACHMDCTQKTVVTHCGCILAVDRAFLKPSLLTQLRNNHSTNTGEPNDGYCTTVDMEGCVQDVLKTNETEVQECMKECHPQCEEWSYIPTLSHLSFPAYAIQLPWEISDKMIRDTLILDINFLQLQYTNVIQVQS